MLLLQKPREIHNAFRPTDIKPMVPDRRQPAVPRQRLRLLQLRIALERLDRILAALLVPRAQVDEQGPVVEGRGGILQRQVADDGEADALVRTGHGGDAGEWRHRVVRAHVRCHGLETLRPVVYGGGMARWRKIVWVTLTLNVGFWMELVLIFGFIDPYMYVS